MRDALDLYDLRAAPPVVSRLRAVDARMREAAAAERFADYYAHSLECHAAPTAASGNPPLARANATAVKGLHLFRRRALLHPARLGLSLRGHEQILAGRDRMLDTLDGGAPASPPRRTRPARGTARSERMTR